MSTDLNARNVLKVKADDPNATDEIRRQSLKKLAGAIAHTLRNEGSAKVRCFGNACIGKAAKAIAIARGMVAIHGYDLFAAISYIEAEMGGATKTGICFAVFSNETNQEDLKELISSKD